MTDISSFIKLSPKESVLENWEVVDDRGNPTLGEIISGVVGAVAGYFALRFLVGFLFEALGIWRLLYDLNLSGLRHLITLAELAGPAGLVAWMLLTRPRIRGHLCLTNWRLLYFAHGQNRFRNLYFVCAADLEDVLGIHTFYTEGLFGQKTLQIVIHTRFRDGISIEAGNKGSWLPVVGAFLVRDTLGKDAFTMLPVLFTRVRQHTGAAPTSSLTY